ncbi:MAG: AAA family ATPase, partial [Saprospiraceae bacterium]|nr:AAA family ATPase [Saprospiraceae bacterium]
MLVERTILNLLNHRLTDRKAILILGPRQTGKSTVLREIARQLNKKLLFLNCDEAQSREALENI